MRKLEDNSGLSAFQEGDDAPVCYFQDRGRMGTQYGANVVFYYFQSRSETGAGPGHLKVGAGGGGEGKWVIFYCFQLRSKTRVRKK